jgi:hypothetical protein
VVIFEIYVLKQKSNKGLVGDQSGKKILKLYRNDQISIENHMFSEGVRKKSFGTGVSLLLAPKIKQ